MNTKGFFKAISFSLLFASSVLTASCDKEDDASIDPAGTVTLNMLDEQNGRTYLGQSDVYINKANNFRTSSCLIAATGQAAGLGGRTTPELDNLVREAAVTPGHVYQIFDSESLREFPSGIKAVQLGADYYKVYAVSPITTEAGTTGTVVKYISLSPDANGLPEYGYQFGSLNHAGDIATMKLPEDAECFWYSGLPEIFDIEVRDDELILTLLKTPTGYNGVSGDFKIYIRKGNVFTSVVVHVN